MKRPIAVISQPCESCGGFSRRKVYCDDCWKLFHPGDCIEKHECDHGFADEVDNDKNN